MTLPPQEASSVYSERLIAPANNWVIATLRYDPLADEETLVVRKSTRVSEFDHWYSPVIDFLSDYCHRGIGQEMIRDPRIVFHCKKNDIRLYKECPGREIDHNCKEGRNN